MRSRTAWLGGGLVALGLVPLVANVALVLARLVGLQVGDVSAPLPILMVVLWGTVYAYIVAGPVAFVLGAAAGQIVRHVAMGQGGETIAVRQGTAVVAIGCALYGAVLVGGSLFGRQIGWVLVLAAAVGGLVGGFVASRAVLADCRFDLAENRRLAAAPTESES